MNVGVTGCTLGGCHGYLSASFGLTSDTVKSFELILANSTVLTVSQSRHPELFWALRGGGGGDFGVVTSMQVEAKLLRGVVVYEIFFDYRGEDQALVVDLLENWQEWALTDLPNGTSAFLKCSSSFTCVARGVQPGRDDRAVQRAVRRLQGRFELEPNAAVEVMQHYNMQQRFSDCETETKLAHKVKSLYYDAPIPAKVVRTSVAVLQLGTGLPEVEWSGFEIQRVGFPWLANGASAADLYHQNQFLLDFSSSWAPSATEEQASAHLEWMRELHMALAPTSTGAYRNYEDLDMGATYFTHATWDHHPAALYYPGDSVLEMEQVKLAFDPALVFKHPLSASFQASVMQEFETSCREREWPPRPEVPVGDLPAQSVLVGIHVQSSQAMQEGQLTEAARRLTHVVYSAVQPIPGGWVNVSKDEEEGQSLMAFAKTVRDANPAAKRIIGVGGAGADASQWLWDEVLASPWQRGNFGSSLRILLDEYDLDGVNIDWTPRWWHRSNFTALLGSVRDSLGPDHELMVHADISKTAVEQGYDVKQICTVSDLVLLRAYDFEHLRPGNQLEWLTHLNANLFSVNPALASGAAGVATWIEAGAPREKLVLGTVTYGYAYDVDGPAPASPGRLDWRVRGKTAALTELSQTPGEAAWSELHDALTQEWSTWTTEEVWELGGATAWSDELRVWVGYDSPQTVQHKAEWIKSMGLAGGMLGPLHLDAYGEGATSLADAFRAALDVEEVQVEEEEDGNSMVLMISLLCIIPAVLLLCCIDAQLRRWGDIRRMHVGLTEMSNTTGSWNARLHTSPQRMSLIENPRQQPLLPLRAEDHRSSESNAHSASLHIARPREEDRLGRVGAGPQTRRFSLAMGAQAVPKSAPRLGNFAFVARRFSTFSVNAAARSEGQGRSPNPGASGGSHPQHLAHTGSMPHFGRTGSSPGTQLNRTGSLMQIVRTDSVRAIQNAFDASMTKGASYGFDDGMQWSRQGIGAVDPKTLRPDVIGIHELSRKLALMGQVKPRPVLAPRRPEEEPIDAADLPSDDGYGPQRETVRYSRLLLRDALSWLDNPENDFMNFYNSKLRGVVKLTCVITMYAETPELLERSLRGIAHGIHQLATETAFLRSWDEAVVVIVADGLSKLPDETAQWLEDMGVYSAKLIENAKKLDLAMEGEQPEVALHCFEGLMQFEDWSPTQTMVVVKQQNAGKLDSQRWAFIGIAERLMPNMPVPLRTAVDNDKEQTSLDGLTKNDLRALDRYLVTVDAGTQPMTNSLRELLIPMRYDPTIAGTCGHMIPDRTCGNVLVMSQVFEYEHGHIVDKSMESMFGFITVLPGAYSAFRYDAIRRDQWVQGRYRREGPLVEYFKPLVQSIDSPALLNMGLAEDRFLCFALMVMKNRNYSLWYCRRALAVTDVPDSLQAFLQQRRRWNNGAFFARLFTIQHYFEIFQGAGHSWLKLLGFVIQLLLTIIDSIFVWFASALFFLWITYNVVRLGEGAAQALGPSFLIMYLLALVAHYDRRLAEIKWVHGLISIILGSEMAFCIGIFVYDQVQDPDLRLIFIVGFSFGAIFLCSLMQGKLLKMCGVMGGYLFMYPTFAILSQLYGFCHVHDVSWGTKGIETVHGGGDKDAQKKEEMVRTALSSFRFRILVSFIISNFVFGYVIGYFNSEFDILLLLLMIVVGANSIRYLGSIAFTIVCWLDDALQLTALHGGILRNFGDEYEQMKVQVGLINAADSRSASDIFYAILNRARMEEKSRHEKKMKEISAEPPQVEVAFCGEESSVPAQAAASEPADVSHSSDPHAEVAGPSSFGEGHRRTRPNLRVEVPEGQVLQDRSYQNHAASDLMGPFPLGQGLNPIPSPYTKDAAPPPIPKPYPSPLGRALNRQSSSSSAGSNYKELYSGRGSLPLDDSPHWPTPTLEEVADENMDIEDQPVHASGLPAQTTPGTGPVLPPLPAVAESELRRDAGMAAESGGGVGFRDHLQAEAGRRREAVGQSAAASAAQARSSGWDPESAQGPAAEARRPPVVEQHSGPYPQVFSTRAEMAFENRQPRNPTGQALEDGRRAA